MTQQTAAERGLARLAELGDEPGGDEFLARMGDLGDWLKDFVFGEVHARPGLDARERELIILSARRHREVHPQVRAHVCGRFARSASPSRRSRRRSSRRRPTPAFPGRSTRSRCCATSRRRVAKAVRFVSPSVEERIGALEGDRVRDAGSAGPRGFVPTPEAWRALVAADGPEYDLGDVRLLHPVVPEKILAIGVNYRSHADESELEVPQVLAVFAKWASALVGPDEDIIPHEETRPDFEGEVAVVLGERVYRADEEQARRAIGGLTATTTSRAAVPSSRRRCVSSPLERASTRSRRSARASPRRTASTSTTSA